MARRARPRGKKPRMLLLDREKRRPASRKPECALSSVGLHRGDISRTVCGGWGDAILWIENKRRHDLIAVVESPRRPPISEAKGAEGGVPNGS